MQPTLSRQAAREILFKLVYEFNINGEFDEFSLKLFTTGLDEKDSEYIKDCYTGITSKAEELKNKIAALSENFSLDRIYKMDLSALMLAIYEIYYREDIPDRVSANEATELSKKYSSEKSYSFVNGLLAAVIKEKESNGNNN